MTLTLSEYRRLTSRVFAASLEPARWQDVLDDLSVLLDGAKLHLFGYDVHRSVDLGVMSANHASEWIELYGEYYAALNPYPVLAQALEPSVPYDLSGLIPERELKRTEYFADFFQPQENLTGGVGMVLEATETAAFVIGTLHPDKYRERLDKNALAVLGMVGRDLGAAWQIAKRLGTAQLIEGRATGGRRLEGIIAMLDQRGWPVFLSADAEQALETGRILRQDMSGRLSFTDKAAQSRLEHHLLHLARPGSSLPPDRFELDSDKRVHCTITALDPDVLGDWGEAFILGMRQPILLVDIDIESAVGPQALQTYGLTPAEYEVTLALAQGLSPADIAAVREVSIHTVRNQMKSAMQKCGVTRQTQLVALVTGNGHP